jgi:hypothetical protein
MFFNMHVVFFFRAPRRNYQYDRQLLRGNSISLITVEWSHSHFPWDINLTYTCLKGIVKHLPSSHLIHHRMHLRSYNIAQLIFWCCKKLNWMNSWCFAWGEIWTEQATMPVNCTCVPSKTYKIWKWKSTNFATNLILMKTSYHANGIHFSHFFFLLFAICFFT